MKYALIRDERLGYIFATKAYNRVQTTNMHPNLSPFPSSNVIFSFEAEQIQKWPQRVTQNESSERERERWRHLSL